MWYILWLCVDVSQVWLKNNLQYSCDTPPRLEVVLKHSVFCVCCAQRKVGTWTSWTILWSVWLNLPATILYALLPLSHMPATSIMAPVLFRGKTIKSYPLLILSNRLILQCFATMSSLLFHPWFFIYFYFFMVCVAVLSLTVTVTILPLLVWPRRSRCLSMARWSRMQLTSTTLLMKWPAIPKSGRPNVLGHRILKNQHEMPFTVNYNNKDHVKGKGHNLAAHICIK